MSLKTKYANKLLNRKASVIKREIELFRFGVDKNVGILWEIKDTEAFRHISSIIQKEKCHVHDLCYKADSTEITSNQSFGIKEVDWLGFPKSEVVSNFINQEFDLLINLASSNLFVMKAVTGLSRAKFKVGQTTKAHDFFDMTVDTGKNPDPKYLGEQLIYYIKEFNKKNSTK